MRHPGKIAYLWFCILFSVTNVQAQQTVIEDTFEDFVDGVFDDAGQNFYVTRDGKITNIHRFDIGQDGWIDLVFPQTHDYANLAAATYGAICDGRTVSFGELHFFGASEVLKADFNNDGWTDLVSSPGRNGIQHPRRFVKVAYGGRDGWPAARTNGI